MIQYFLKWATLSLFYGRVYGGGSKIPPDSARICLNTFEMMCFECQEKATLLPRNMACREDCNADLIAYYEECNTLRKRREVYCSCPEIAFNLTECLEANENNDIVKVKACGGSVANDCSSSCSEVLQAASLDSNCCLDASNGSEDNCCMFTIVTNKTFIRNHCGSGQYPDVCMVLSLGEDTSTFTPSATVASVNTITATIPVPTATALPSASLAVVIGHIPFLVSITTAMMT